MPVGAQTDVAHVSATFDTPVAGPLGFARPAAHSALADAPMRFPKRFLSRTVGSVPVGAQTDVAHVSATFDAPVAGSVRFA